MKNYISILVSYMAIVMLVSCSSFEDIVTENKSVSKECNILIVSMNEMKQICDTVAYLCESNDVTTRTFSEEKDHINQSTELSIQQTVQPLKESGESYVDIMIDSYKVALETNTILQENILTEEELEILNNLSDEELTLIGMQLSIFSDVYDNATIENDVMQISLSELMNNQYVVCFLKATGIADITGGVKALRDWLNNEKIKSNIFKTLFTGDAYSDAKTITQLLKAMGVKYLGWIGVGCMVYEYYQCIN